jgi:uncharacterized membrane protein
MGEELQITGPVQMLIVGFEEPNFTGEIIEELKRLKEADVIRLIDMLLLVKDEDGSVETIRHSDLTQEEAMEFGAYVGALVGLGAEGEEGAEAGAVVGAAAMEDGHVFDEDQVWYAADVIPAGSAAAIALIEHRWAIPLRNAIVRAGGLPLADEWIHATDLIAIGLKVADEAAAQQTT